MTILNISKRTCGSNPISSILSASSSTKYVTLLKLVVPASKWSIKRPGVAITISTPFLWYKIQKIIKILTRKGLQFKSMKGRTIAEEDIQYSRFQFIVCIVPQVANLSTLRYTTVNDSIFNLAGCSEFITLLLNL